MANAPTDSRESMSSAGSMVVQRRRVVGLIRACHFQPTLAVTAMTTVLALTSGRGIGSLAVCVAVLVGQCSTGWSNDWRDAPRDFAAGRRDKPIVAGLVSRSTVGWASALAFAGAVPLSLLSGWRAAVVHLVAIASAWSYNLALKTTVFSPVPYAVSFALLPAFVTLGLTPSQWPAPSLMAAGAALGVGAHFINTLSDRLDDAATGVRGLPQRLTTKVTLGVGVGLLTSGAVFAFIAGQGTLAEIALLCAALACNGIVVALTVGHKPRAAWSATLVGVVFIVVLFVTAGASLRT